MPNAIPQFDLGIIGGGPAGTSAAITAAQMGTKVALFEARDFPRHKVCGEFVSAEALDLLAGLVQDVPETADLLARAPVIKRTRLLFGGRVIEVEVSPPALSIPRYDLDALLWNAVQLAGVEVHPNCEVTACDGESPFTLQTFSGAFTAKGLLVAAGRWSQFTGNRTLPPGPKWIGVKAHFREIGAEASTDLYFFEHGYCGVQPIAADIVNACAMVRSDHATSLQEVFGLHPKLAERAAGWQAGDPADSAPLRWSIASRSQSAATYSSSATLPRSSIPLPETESRSRCAAGESRQSACGSSGKAEIHWMSAVAAYRHEYVRQFAPLISAAARVRSLFSLPAIAKPAVFELLRLPGLIPYVIRKDEKSSIEIIFCFLLFALRYVHSDAWKALPG